MLNLLIDDRRWTMESYRFDTITTMSIGDPRLYGQLDHWRSIFRRKMPFKFQNLRVWNNAVVLRMQSRNSLLVIPDLKLINGQMLFVQIFPIVDRQLPFVNWRTVINYISDLPSSIVNRQSFKVYD